MELNLYLLKGIYIPIYIICMILILGFSTKSIIRTSHTRLFITFIFSTLFTRGVMTLGGKYLLSFTNNYLSFMDSNLFVTIVEAFVIAIIFGFFISNYLHNRSYFVTGMVVFFSSIILNYWLIPTLVEKIIS